MTKEEETKSLFDALSQRASRHGLVLELEVFGSSETARFSVFRSGGSKPPVVVRVGATLQQIGKWLDHNHPE